MLRMLRFHVSVWILTELHPLLICVHVVCLFDSVPCTYQAHILSHLGTRIREQCPFLAHVCEIVCACTHMHVYMLE